MSEWIPPPPLPVDESKFLVVVHPYPLNANLELHADQCALALWLACCTGKDVLRAMYYKPSSPEMVVIEVDREFERFHELLGLHVWSDFLMEPTEEQMDKSSTVFYSTYNTGRLNRGWKRVNFEEHLFQGLTANNSIIRYPYPKTSHCNGVSSEAKSGAPTCSLLRQQHFPVPLSPPAPPSSAEWLSARNANAALQPTIAGMTAAPASDTASVTSASFRSTKLPPAQSLTSSSVMATYRAKNEPWKRGPPSVSSKASVDTSRAPSTVGISNNSSDARSPRAALPAPPGLGPRLIPQSRWSKRLESTQINTPPASNPASRFSPNSALCQSYGRNGSIEPSRVYDYDEEDQPRLSTVPAMSDLLDKDFFPVATSVRSDIGGTEPLGLDDPDYDPWNPPADAAAPVSNHSPARGATNLWEGYDAPQLEPPTKVKKKGEWTCPQHGSLCSPGICKERARFERDERMRDERGKWEGERMQREAWRAKEQLKMERKNGEGKGEWRYRPPHLRGYVSSSISGSDSDTSHKSDSSASPRPDQKDWSVPWNTGGADTQSTVRSARHAWDSVTKSDDDEEDEDDDGVSVARSHTSSAASCGSRASLSASVSSSGRINGPMLSTTPAGPTPTSPTSATWQPSWDACSAASQSSSVGGRSEQSSLDGDSRASAVSAASSNGSDTGSSTRESTCDTRSSAFSSARPLVGPSTPATSLKPNGFPTSPNVLWGNPIAIVLAETAKEDNRKKVTNREGEQKVSKSTRKRRNKLTSAWIEVQAQAQATQASLLEAALGIELPPGGPGSSWGVPGEVW